jgi:hypothetical protein
MRTSRTCYSTVLSQVNSELDSKVENRRSVQRRGHQLLRRVGLAVRLMEVSGGMVMVRATEQESLEY